MTVLAVATDHTNVVWGVPTVYQSYSYPDYFFSSSATDRYDQNVARNAIQIQSTLSEPSIDLGAEYSEFWLHFSFDYNLTVVTAGLSLIDTYDASGNLQIGIVENATGPIDDVRKSTNGTTYGTTFAGTLTTSSATRVTWDIHYKIHASLGEIHIYQDGTLAYTFTGDTSTNGSNAIRYVRFTGGRATTKYVSEIVAATESTVGWKVSNLAPITGTQDFSAWTGDYSYIDEYNYQEDGSVFANTADATSSFAIDDLDASLAGMVVKAVVACARVLSTPGATTPNIDVGLSISSTFYSGGTTTLDPLDGATRVVNIFETNPATATAFTQSDVNGLQLALRAKT